MKKCEFCLVVKNNYFKHEIIFSDKKHLVVLDANPTKDGHVLVLPKKHTNFLFDLNEKEYVALLKLSRKIALHIKKALKSKHVYVFIKGLKYKHVHVHLIPVNKNNAGHLPRQKRIDKGKLKKIGEILRGSILS